MIAQVAMVGAVGAAAVVAAESPGLPPWAQVLLGLGAFMGVITKQIVPGWMYNDKVAEKVAAEVESKRLVGLLLETQPKAIAAMEASNRVIEEAMAEIRARRRAE